MKAWTVPEPEPRLERTVVLILGNIIVVDLRRKPLAGFLPPKAHPPVSAVFLRLCGRKDTVISTYSACKNISKTGWRHVVDVTQAAR